MDNITKFYSVLENSILKLIENGVAMAPKILGALLLLIAGYFIAKFFGWMFRKVSVRLGIDGAFKKSGLLESMERANVKLSPSVIFGKLAFWITILFFILMIFDLLGIKAVQESFTQLVTYIPNLFVAVVILVLGLSIAQVVRSTVSISLDRMTVEFSSQIAGFVYYIILILSAMMAFRQLKIDISAFENLIYIVFATLIVFGGILLAWGSRSVAENVIAGIYLKKIIKLDMKIKIDDVSGKVLVVEQTHTVLESGSNRILIPNSRLLKEVAIQN